MSREKGKRGEREIASILRNEYGYNCRRGQQYCGRNGDADVVGLPYLHIEVKRVEHLNIKAALIQSIQDARVDEIPVVMHRKNNEEWMVSLLLCDIEKINRKAEMNMNILSYRCSRATVKLSDFMEVYKEYEAGVTIEKR